MRKLLLCILLFSVQSAFALSISVLPEKIIQGDPMMITFEVESATSSVSSVSRVTFTNKDNTLLSKVLSPFLFDTKVRALYGVDLNQNPGVYTIVATLADGTTISKDITIEARKRIEAPLGIPEKLGGNTVASQQKLVDTLASENLSLLNVRTGTRAFWTEPFRYPVADPKVTDEYGYIRQTGSFNIAHKGTDFRADTGTPVMAMNRGVVRIAKTYRNYGKTVVVDHGLGLMTFYMHLSKIYVGEGTLVMPGQILGVSGKTGYAESPHLHLTVRINHISIDPMVFLSLFK